MNNYILARWRDAITDPPADGWKGHVRREWRNGTVYQYCTEYMTNPHSFEFQGERRVFYHVMPGDQWLDITTIPGVAREGVQAAVNEMARFNCRNIGVQNGAWSGRIVLDASLDTIRDHTGVTPTEVTDA